MISLTTAKEEDTKNIFMKLQSELISRISQFSDLTGELFISNYIYTLICLSITFSKFIGIIVYSYTEKGLLANISNNIFNIINLTNFLLDKGVLSELMVICFFIKNIYLILSSLLIFFNNSQNKSNIIFYQFIFSSTFWLTFHFEFEFGIYNIYIYYSSNNIKAILDILYLIVNISNIFCCIFISIGYSLYFNKIEINIESDDYLTRLDCHNEFALFALKIIYSIVYTINLITGETKININIFLAILLIFHSIYFIYFLTACQYFFRSTHITFVYFNSACIYTLLVSFLIHNSIITDTDIIIYCGLLALYPILYYIDLYLITYYMSKISYELNSQIGLNRYLIKLIQLYCEVINNNNHHMKLILYGAVKFHQETCIYNECACKLKEGAVLYIPKNKAKFIIDTTYNKPKEYNPIYILHLIKSIFEFHVKIEKSTNINLHILYCYFMNHYIGNFFYSLYFIINLKENEELNIQQKVSLERILQINNKVLEKNLDKLEQIDNSSNIKIDFTEIINFYTQINNLKTNINLSLEMAFLFWNAILLKMDLITIKAHGLKFSKFNTEVENTFKMISETYSGYKEVNNLYQSYEAYIFGNTYASAALKGNIDKEIHIKMQKERYFSKSSAFIIANITDKSKAIIEKITENVNYFLGLNPSECLGQDVKILMPMYYKIRHSTFLDCHFRTGINKILNSERNVFSLHSLGYSIPTKIIVKLSNSISSINYLGFLRESRVDYDFFIVSKQGQIILYSKNLYDKLIKDHKYYDNNNNYLHFICKEYLDEIEHIYDTEYEITDFSQKDQKLEKYGFFQLHFGINKQVEEHLKSDKKHNKDYQNKEVDLGRNNTDLPQMIMKLISKREEIKGNFLNEVKTKNSIKFFAKKEYLNLCEEEQVIIIKLYTKLNLDSSIYKEDLNDIENYLKKLEFAEENKMKNYAFQNLKFEDFNYDKEKDKEESKLQLNDRKERKGTNKDLKSLNDAFELSVLQQTDMKKEEFKNKKMDITNSSMLSSIARNNENKSLSYALLKKRFFEKDNTRATILSLLLNSVFFIITIVIMVISYFNIYISRLNFSNSINSNYFNVLNTVQNFIYADENIKYVLIKNQYAYLQKQQTTNELSNIKQSLASLNTAMNIVQEYNAQNYQIFINFLTNQPIIVKLNNFNSKLSVSQIISINSLYIEELLLTLPYIIADYSLNIVNSNEIINILNQEKLNLEQQIKALQFQQLLIDYNNLVSVTNLLNIKNQITQQMSSIVSVAQAEAKNKNIYYIIITIFLSLLSLISFLKIIIFYFDQNKMISLLFSLDERIAKEILWSIRTFKGFLLQRGQESEYEDEDDEKANLIKDSKDEKTDNSQADDKDRKGALKQEKLELTEKLAKKNKSIIFQVNWSIYIQSFLILAFLSIVTLIPIIYYFNTTFFEDKLITFLNLMNVTKLNQYSVMLLFTTFIDFNHFINDKVKLVDIMGQYTNITLDYNTLNKNSSDLMFNLIDGINGTADFDTFYSSNVCNVIDATYCISTTNSTLSGKGYKYYQDVYSEIIWRFMNRNINSTLIQTVTESQILSLFTSDENLVLLKLIFDYMYNQGNILFDNYLISILRSYENLYMIHFNSIFFSTLVLIFIYLVCNVLLIKQFNYSVNIEIKKLFSLIPQVVVLSNQGIYELFSS